MNERGAGASGRRAGLAGIDPRRRVLVVALPLAVAGAAVPAWLPAARFAPPARARGAAVLGVRGFGAIGDGVRDDTDAFQRAIDALPDDGGTVDVPAGNYLIDPTRRVRLRSRMHLRLAPDARLVARPNAEPRTYVLLASQVSDVEISGGQVVGDRDAHAGGGEWGHGIAVRGSARVTVRDVRVSRCWGDGVSVGGERPGARGWASIPSEDVVLSGVASIGNRRQGLTIAHARDVQVHGCEFADTAGTLPECGIDIEPDPPGVTNRATIEDCRIHGNRGSGIQIHKRTRGVTIRGCTIEGNGGYGVLAVGSEEGTVVDNVIRGNALQGVGLRGGTRDFNVAQNTLSDNRLRRKARGRGTGANDRDGADDDGR